MLDPASESYQQVIDAFQQVVDETADPKARAKRQRRLDKMKAKREAAISDYMESKPDERPSI